MKKFIIAICTLIFSTFLLQTYAQGISNPQPLLLDENGLQNIVPGVDIHLGCGNNNLIVEASYPSIGNTTEYTVESIPYAPKRYLTFDGTTVSPPPGPGSFIDNSIDDEWSQEHELRSNGVDLDFCYFGNSRKYFRTASNGAVSFNTTGNYPTPPSYPLYEYHDYASWTIQNMGKIGPDANMDAYRESILTPFHDTNPADGSADLDAYAFWDIRGNIDERFFIMGFHNVPMYSCSSNNGTATHQMVFYETTNIIEFHIKDKPICDGWADGYAALGIQNKDLDVGYSAPGRDNLELWQVLEDTSGGSDPSYPVEPSESWRFIPSGGTTRPDFTWYKNYNFTTDTGDLIDASDIDPSMTLDPNEPYQNFRPSDDTTYTAQVIYTDFCSGVQTIATQSVTIIIDELVILDIVDSNSPTDVITDRIDLCIGSNFISLQAAIQTDITGATFTYEWTRLSDNVVVGSNPTFDIISNDIGLGPETFELLIEVFDASNTFICNDSYQVDVLVIDQENPAFNYLDPAYCATTDSDPLPQNIITPGGVFTINNGGAIDASTGEIDLTASGAGDDNTGDFIITYTTPNPNCGDSTTFNLSISSGDSTITYDSGYCSTGVNPIPTNTPSPGGNFTIVPATATIDIVTGEIIASSLIVGTNYQVTYTITGICGSSSQSNFTVTAAADATFSYPAIVCLGVNASPTVNTGGGTFTIDGTASGITGSIDTASGEINTTSEPGDYQITYTTTGCVGSSTITVTVNALEIAAFEYPDSNNTNVCAGDGNITPILGTNTTTGGEFTISSATAPLPININTGEISVDNTITTATTYDVTYTTLGPCPDVVLHQITINPEDNTAFTYNGSSFCIADGNISPNTTPITTGGTYTINNGGIINPTTGEIDVSATTTGDGTYEVTYETPLTNTCSNFSTYTVTITNQDNTSFGYDSGISTSPSQFCVSYITATPTPAPAASGGTWTITNGGIIDSNGNIDLVASGLGTDLSGNFNINYATTGSCANSSQFNISISISPIVDSLVDQTHCDNYTLLAITGTDLTGNQLYYDSPDGPNGTGNVYNAGFTFNNTTAGITYPLTLYIYDESITNPVCFDEKSFVLTINATPDITPLANAIQEHCDSYELPVIVGTNITANAQYYTQPNGGGTAYAQLTTIDYTEFTASEYPKTLYIYDETATSPNCSDEESFTLTLKPTPQITSSLGVETHCDTFTLPTITGNNLTGNEQYYSLSGGNGDLYNAGFTFDTTTLVTYPLTLHIYDATVNPLCFNEHIFTLTIETTPDVFDLVDQRECGFLDLPVITGTNLTGNEQYYTGTGGTGTAYVFGDRINYVDFTSYPITLYIFDSTGNPANCSDEESFSLILDEPDDSNVTYLNEYNCISDGNISPTYSGLPGGVFSINNGGIIDVVNGDITIDPNALLPFGTDGTGMFTIEYLTTGPCPTASNFDIVVTPTVDASFTYPIFAVCESGDNPIPDNITTTGGIFTVDNGADIDVNTGQLDLENITVNETYTITYTLNATDTNACTDVQIATIEVIGSPVFEVPFQAYICPSAGIDTEIMVTNAEGDYTYEWFRHDDNSAYILVGVGDTLTLNDPSEIGIYKVTAKVATADPSLFCEASQLVSVGMAEQVVISNIHVDDFNRPNNSITIEVEGGSGNFTYTIIDENGNETTQDNNPYFENVTSDIYTIQISDNDTCSETIFRQDVVVLDYPLYFTPNGDTNHDTWNINNSHFIPGSKIYIFDRYGKVLAQVDPNGIGWNGVYLGKQLPATDYWFTAEYLDPNTALPKTVKGHFSIIRRGSIN